MHKLIVDALESVLTKEEVDLVEALGAYNNNIQTLLLCKILRSIRQTRN